MTRTHRRGFTILELVVVIAIIAVLIAFLVPATRRVSVASIRAQCQYNLKQILFGLHGYHDVHRGTQLPSADESLKGGKHGFPPGCINAGSAPEERLSWIVAVLPYVEQQSLYNQLNLKADYDANRKLTDTMLAVFHCPSSIDNGPVSTYFALAGIGRDAPLRPFGDPRNGFMGFDRPNSLGMIKDGTSQTIALAETSTNLGPWARGGFANVRGFVPTDLPLHGENRPFMGHTNIFNAGMADGSVRFVKGSIDPHKLAATITIAGGEDAATYLD